LPRRVLNYTLPGHNTSTLDEADAWITAQLRKAGYSPETDNTRVQAFGRDFSKPIAHQYAPPPVDAPWYIAHNIIAEEKGSEHPDELIIIIAHKDSQSWIASPGANDNAVGTCGALETATVLSGYKPRHTIRFIFCNEEHTPWTSVTAAEEIKKSGSDVLALINMDGIGVKPPSEGGQLTNVTRYTSPEGEKLADLMAILNEHHNLGLKQSKYLSDSPGDDDGSFIKAGFPWSVLNIGSMPYGDPNYHQEGDTPDKVDFKNAAVTVELTLAAVLHLDIYGRP
jgi:Zn-dependent M28 family amino/carboxypeptidase